MLNVTSAYKTIPNRKPRMAPPSIQPLVFVRLLADRQRQLDAVLWHADPADAERLDTTLTQPEWSELSPQLPCLWADSEVARWSPDCLAALASSGGTPIHQAQVCQCNTDFLPDATAQWISGQWYLQPPTHAGKAQSTSRTLTLQLMQLVNTDADTRELEDVFRRDASLSYQLLKLVNSAAMRRSREITSFTQAILLLGRQQLKRWLNLLMFAARDGDDRGNLLLAHVSLRGRGMELLAQASGLDRAMQEQAFMTGMFSLLGVLFGSPLPELLAPLQLGEDMNAALLRHEGELGTLLRDWLAIEQADAPAVRAALAERGVAPQEHNQALLQACQWMLGLTRVGAMA